MKKLIIIQLVLLTFALTGCQALSAKLAEWKAAILNKTEEVGTEAKERVDEIKTQLNETKDSVEKKIDDIQNAAKEVNEAVDAVKKVTE